jgi:hypothetical protein
MKVQLMMGWASPAMVLRYADEVAQEVAAARARRVRPDLAHATPLLLEIHCLASWNSTAFASSLSSPTAGSKQWSLPDQGGRFSRTSGSSSV